jgi:hypothetical protein
MNQLIKWLDLYFGQKAPQLPGKAKEFLVTIAPWLAIIGVVLAIPAILAVFGFSRFAFSMMGGYGYMGYSGFGLGWAFLVASTILNALAIPGLRKRSLVGWNFVFYGVLVGGVQNLFMMNVVGMVISLAIGFYILFQVRPLYTGQMEPMVPPQQK